MDLDQLQSVRDRERQTDRLQQLRESFYEDAADFVADLRAERDGAAADAEDPFDSPRVNRLTDRIRTAEQTLEAIYEKRVGKVVKAATFAAADLPAEAEGMTKEEADLFETLVAEIEANRARVLDQLTDERAGDADVGPGGSGGDRDASGTRTADDAVGAADVMGGDAVDADATGSPPDDANRATPPEAPDAPDDRPPEPGEPGESGDPGDEEGAGDDSPNEPSAASPDSAPSGGPADDEPVGDVDRELVRITDDVGPILGVDEREYDLSADDVVTLPAENARPLVERGAAERLE